MRLEGNWVIAETGQDRRVLAVRLEGDEYRSARPDATWTPYTYRHGHPYVGDEMRGFLVRRHRSKCSPEIMALLVPQPHAEMEHFI